MNQNEKTKRWFAAWRAAPEVEADDPADMGTAFGLDLSMEQGLPTPPVKAPSFRSKPALPEAGWASRFGLRRRQA